MASKSFKFGSFTLSDYLSSFRVSIKNRIAKQIIPYKDGADIDEALLEPLVITVEGDVVGTSDTNTRTLIDALLKAICNGKQYLRLWDDRYVNAQKQSLEHEYQKALERFIFKATFIADTPFWIADTASQDIEISAGSRYSITTIGSAYNYPSITFAADQGVALNAISLENETDDKKMGYIATVENGNSLIINCATQSVQNNGVDDLANFSGDFLRLLSGANSLLYAGQACTITFDWSERYY